jgi:hypothetical protein
VARGGSEYERELRRLLAGEPEAIAQYGRRLPPTERAVLAQSARSPFLVVRAAGSFGFDLVALRSEFAFPLEVKASGSDTIHFSAASGRADDQLQDHRRAVDRVGLLVVYAFRRLGQRSGDSWRLFATGRATGAGLSALLLKRLPPVPATKEGNGVLRWETGMPLVRFLELVAFWTNPAPGTAA